MFRYFNDIAICKSLTTENRLKQLEINLKQLEINRLNEVVKKLEQENNDLIYKYNGVLVSKQEIYEKYQNTILKK
jgi:hypothetical protein